MIHFINESNELKNRKFPIPDGVREKLTAIRDGYNGDKNISGYKRLCNILDMDGIKYSEMKRIKNFFDNYEGSDKSMEYILNGGEAMNLWVTNTLYTATKSVHDYKQAKKDAGIKNAFIKPHNKERQIRKNKPTQTTFKTNNISNAISSNNMLKYETKTQEMSPLNEDNIVSFIPKKVFRQVQKLNDDISQQKAYMETDYCLMERDGHDYSLSTIVINDKGEMEYDLEYNDYRKTHYHETIALVRTYEGETWFDEDEYMDYMRHYKSDLKRALKFFKDYGSKESDYDENGEDNVLKRINNESKHGITVRVTEGQLRKIQENRTM